MQGKKMSAADLPQLESTEKQYPIGDDLIWYELQLINRDFDSLKWRVEKLGRQLSQTLENHCKVSDDLMKRVATLTAEIAALKGVTNA